MAVVFSSACGERPVRLCERTREFAARSLRGEYGDEAMRLYAVSLDDVEGFDALSPTEKFDIALRRLVERVPVRVIPEETVSGSACLGLALEGYFPATRGGKPVIGAVDHLTLNFARAVREGVDSFEERIRESRAAPGRSPEQLRFLDSLQNVIDCMRIYHARVLAVLRETHHPVAEYFSRVPFAPPESFREALQSLWFCFAFTRLCGNWPGIGRIDQILGPYLQKDLAMGRITIDKARELLAGFFIKGCEWVRSNPPRLSGDAQHYQNIVLGGLSDTGEDSANEVSDLVIDIVEELPIGDFPISVRLSDKTSASFRAHLARAVRHGGGAIALYNERLVLDSLISYGYSPEEARSYANDGCWEVQVPGATSFIYYPFDALRILLDRTLDLGGEGEPPSFSSFSELKNAYFADLSSFTREFVRKNCIERRVVKTKDGWTWKTSTAAAPYPVVALFEDDCIARAQGYYSGGARHTVVSPHIGGAPDAANSLYALKKLAFDEKKISLRDLILLLRRDWEDGEPLRVYARSRLTYYGNDAEEPGGDGADDLLAQILHVFASTALEMDKVSPVRTAPGVSTFGRQIDWAPYRRATPSGRHAHEVLASNLSPTPGDDTTGATAVLRSYGKANLRELPGGVALDLKLLPSTVSGENGAAALEALFEGFLACGGFFLQPDVVDSRTLREAKAHPEDYRTLSVRVSGWNARFVTLDERWQDMIIARTEQGM